MKNSFLKTIVFGFMVVVSSPALAEGLQDGFGGIAWVTPLEAVKDCEKVEERGDIHYCMRRDQTHTLLGEFVPDVLYGFYREAFFSVFIRVADEEAYRETRARLKDRLGSPEASLDKDGMVSVLRWTRDKVRVELHNDRSIQGFQVAYIYVPIADKVARQHKTFKPGRWPNIKLFTTEQSEDEESVKVLRF